MRERGGCEGGSFDEAPVPEPPLTLPYPLRERENSWHRRTPGQPAAQSS
ncbi:hypothetical protein CBM2623_B170270 [Cupriavidus taiwanensis]|nr:hypothetical protein CBM2608_B140341 [Cupriavidus taiwanensis]SPA33226.1 hypothetical protein CBM2623_B170270 [Cupriavidus taiwanensis]